MIFKTTCNSCNSPFVIQEFPSNSNDILGGKQTFSTRDKIRENVDKRFPLKENKESHSIKCSLCGEHSNVNYSDIKAVGETSEYGIILKNAIVGSVLGAIFLSYIGFVAVGLVGAAIGVMWANIEKERISNFNSSN